MFYTILTDTEDVQVSQAQALIDQTSSSCQGPYQTEGKMNSLRNTNITKQ